MSEQEKIVEEVMGNFDFEKVKRVMDMLEWKYAEGDLLMTPSTYRIIQFSRSLLLSAVAHINGGQVVSYRSGGFVATTHGNGDLMLEFVIAKSETGGD